MLLKRSAKTTNRRPSKKKYLDKFVLLEGSLSPRSPWKVLSAVWKELWDHQRSAASFTLKHRGNFLAMEVGTGKTLTTLASLAKRHARGSVDLVHIICPASAVQVWKDEIAKWLPGTTLTFLIVSFDFARFYFKYLRKEKPDAFVIDEIHKLKNPNSAQSRRIAKVTAEVSFKYGLTGTPVADNVIDLFGQYRAIDPTVLGDHWPSFRQDFLYRTGYMGYELGITDKRKKEVLDLIAPITYQVLKREVFDFEVAPPTILYAELKGTQKKLYRQLERDMVAKHAEFTVTSKRAITTMLRLQQITGGYCPSDDGDMLTFECGKADVLRDYLSGWNRKKKIVIFARYIHELETIAKICRQLKMSHYTYTPKEPLMDKKFQEEEAPLVSINQYQRGGISRTLTRSSTPIFFSKTFSSIDYVQAVGRVDRGGQTELVSPIFINTRGTIDEDVDEVVEGKLTEAQFVKKFLKKIRLKHV